MIIVSEVTHPLRSFQVVKAQETEEKIGVELKELQATLANIEEARPFKDLTVRVVILPSECSCF